MTKVKFLFFLSLNLVIHAQDKMPETELLVRRFIHALIDKDEARIKALCLDHHNLKSLWQGKIKPENERDQLKRELSKLDIDWLEVDDTFRLNDKLMTVNENMVTKSRQIARVKMIEYGFPIQISKLSGQWYIQPLLIVNIFQREIIADSRKNRRNFTITIDGKDIPLNENEEGTLKLPDGKELKISLRKNLYQNFEDSKVHISYSRDLNISKNLDENCIVYRLSGELSPSLMVQVYEKDKSLEEVRKYVTESFIENYRSMGYTLKNPPILEIDIARKNKIVKGHMLKYKNNNVTYFDRYFFWQEKNQVVGIVAQTELTDLTAATDYLNHVINELEIKSN